VAARGTDACADAGPVRNPPAHRWRALGSETATCQQGQGSAARSADDEGTAEVSSGRTARPKLEKSSTTARAF
jgi:hypothetical protein